MTFIDFVEWLGEAPVSMLMGAATGITFGVAAQRSRFCLRAATVEFTRRKLGPSVAVWLLTFSIAVVWVQAAAASPDGPAPITIARMKPPQ